MRQADGVAKEGALSTTILRAPQREELEQSITLLRDVPDVRAQQAIERIRAALEEADQEEYLTTAEAARALGIRSVNTIKLWVKTGYLIGRRLGGRTLIPLSEIERLEHDERVRVLRAVGRLHEETSNLGREEGMTPEELRSLEEGRPGILPWQRERE